MSTDPKTKLQYAPQVAPAFKFLATSEAGNYVYQYAAYAQSMSKMRELEGILASGGGTPQDIQHLNALKEEIEKKTWGRGYMDPPEIMIAEKSPYFDPANGRVLVARRLSADKLAYVLYRSYGHVIEEVVSSLVWDDRSSRNNPYTLKCIYPMTERNTACGFYADLEEEFDEPREPYDVPTNEQLLEMEASLLLEPEDEGYESKDPTERYILAEQKRAQVVRGARARYEQKWMDREAAFAVRCRWAMLLVKQSIMALYGIDMAESPVWWYTACSRFKNSFRVYVPDWVFDTTKSLKKVMANALAMLNLMADNHPCKVALKRGPGTKVDRNPYIIDWGVYNKHRQMRAPFQPKDPGKRNAFVPYDCLVLGRIPIRDRQAARIWFEPSLCVAMRVEQFPRLNLRCFLDRHIPKFGDKLWSDIRAAQLACMEYALDQAKRNRHKIKFSVLVTAAILVLKPTPPLYRMAKDRLASVRKFITSNNTWVMNLAVPPGSVERYRARMHVLLLAFLSILCSEIARYAFSRRDDSEDFFGQGVENMVFPHDRTLTAGMRSMFVRTAVYYNIFAMVALGRNSQEALSADLSVSTLTYSKSDLAKMLDQHHLNLIHMHSINTLGAVTRTVAPRSYGSLMAFDPGLMGKQELDILWEPTQDELEANAPPGTKEHDNKRKKEPELATFWEMVETDCRYVADKGHEHLLLDDEQLPPSEPIQESSRSGDAEPNSKRQAVQDIQSAVNHGKSDARPIISQRLAARPTPLQRSLANKASAPSLFSFQGPDGRTSTHAPTF